MGGNSGAVQSSTTKSEPWTELQQPIKDVLGNAQTLYGQEYIPYTGQTVSGPSDSTVAGYNLGYQASTLSSPDMLAARGMLTDVSGGNFFGSGPTGTNAWLNKTAQGQQGPTASNAWLGGVANGTQQGPTAANNWLNSTAQGQQIGANPYLNDTYTNNAINFNANQMGNAFATGTAAQNDAAFARGGAYGGSAWQQKQSADAAAMAGQVGNMANTYNLGLQNTKAADYQQAVQAAMGAAGQQQAAYGQNVGMGLQAAGQQQAAYGQDAGIGINAAGLQQNAYGTDMSNMMQAASMAPQFANSDFQAADYLRNMGAQQEGYQQKLLDAQQSSWQQAMNAPYNQMQGYANLLSQFAGTGSTGSTQVYGGGQSPLGLGVGAGLLGLGAYNALGKGG
jgi:hypothetical protein